MSGRIDRIAGLTRIAGIIMLLCLSSCKMSQFVSKHAEKSNVEQKNDIQEHTSTKTDLQVNEKSNEKTELKQNEIEITVVVKWSPPDSSGHQYPVETTTKQRQTVTDKQTEISAGKEEKTKIETIENKEDKSINNAKTDIKVDEKTKTKPASPAWITWVAVILAVGLLVLVYLVLKRYRIIR